MDRNKNEAIKAKKIAEKFFTEMGDIAGAKRIALRAQNLYPSLEGLASFNATLDVYISANKIINGETDWYGVLGVDPMADDETIKRNYRKLVLLLHPDKNKSVGADGAFQLASEAWSLLSDTAKRIAYDQKLKFNPKIPNGFHDFMGVMNSSTTRNPTTSSSSSSTTLDPVKLTGTFWTTCNSCNMQFEYLRKYLNQNLVCAQCNMPFIAIESPPPSIHAKGSWNCHVQRQSSTNHNAGPVKPNAPPRTSPIFSRVILSKAGGGGRSVATHPSEGAFDYLKRRGESTHVGNIRASVKSGNFNMSATCRRDYMKVVSQLDVRSALMGKTKRQIQQKFKESNSASQATKSLDTETKMKEEKVSTSLRGTKTDESKTKVFMDTKPGIEVKESSFPDSSCGPDPGAMEEPDALTMSVPDPDFYDFDKDRSEKSFSENQVWAAYDDDDGMPRYYAMIHNVISLKPFKLYISWLNSKNNDELGPLNWIGSGFYKTSGNFWIGKRVVNRSLNSFSHKVKWRKGAKGVVQIYPKKGEIWALYRNWSPDWNEFTPDEVIQKYDMVEVLDDFNEERGVMVSSLVKVAGFKTVFRRHPKSYSIKILPKNEMFRFSHQVASYLLTGQEGHNFPKGCLELDPAAMPSELLQVLDEKQVRDMEDSIEKAKEEIQEQYGKEEILENHNTRGEKGFGEESKKKVAEEGMLNKRKEMEITGERKVQVYKRRRLEHNESKKI